MSIFTEVQKRTLPRNQFDMSFDNKFSTDFGNLVPMLCQELMPGDSIQHNHEIYAQMAPMESLCMHKFFIRTEYFFVPNRLVYEEFNSFLVGGEDGTDILTPPYITLNRVYNANRGDAGSLADYLGVPSPTTFGGYTSGRAINSMPFRAYQLIYNDWYRDENLIEKLEIPKSGGAEETADELMLLTLRKRAWKKDYFTSALPWPQKGPTVKIPLGDVAYVYPYAVDTTTNAPFQDQGSPLGQTMELTGGPTTLGLNAEPATDKVTFDKSSTYGEANAALADAAKAVFTTRMPGDEQGTIFGLVADLRAATATSLEEFRRAQVVQNWLEMNAIGGTRDVEMIYNHFGVKAPDYRLGRPEYLAGYSQDMNIGNVYSTNTSNTDGNIQGEPTSIGNSSDSSEMFEYTAVEHGYLIGILSVIPKASYFQGLHPMLGRRQDKFDYYWPEFADLGEQPIYADEVFQNSNEKKVFGYTPRYAEYKFANDEVHGDYRTTLNTYHDARIFTAEPLLNQDFIEVTGGSGPASLNRVFNQSVEGSHHIYVDIYHNISKVSNMVYFGNPKVY